MELKKRNRCISRRVSEKGKRESEMKREMVKRGREREREAR